eukprot:8565794-Ditylum_brightwellii.AAC.1
MDFNIVLLADLVGGVSVVSCGESTLENKGKDGVNYGVNGGRGGKRAFNERQDPSTFDSSLLLCANLHM